jgi:hypothetical protein
MANKRKTKKAAVIKLRGSANLGRVKSSRSKEDG